MPRIRAAGLWIDNRFCCLYKNGQRSTESSRHLATRRATSLHVCAYGRRSGGGHALLCTYHVRRLSIPFTTFHNVDHLARWAEECDVWTGCCPTNSPLQVRSSPWHWAPSSRTDPLALGTASSLSWCSRLDVVEAVAVIRVVVYLYKSNVDKSCWKDTHFHILT